MACASVTVPVGVPLSKRNMMSLYDLESLKVNCRKAKDRGYFIGQPPSSQKTWRNQWFFAFGNWECWLGKTVSIHVPAQFQSIGSMKCRAVSREEEEEIELESRLVPAEACEIRNIVTPVLFLELGLLQGMVEVPKTIVTVKGSPKVAVDQEERQRKL
ncbi:unnamed protein product [Prunus armeniaca]